MRDDPIVQQVRDAIHRRDEKPPDVRIEDMVTRGVIDRDGNVLLQMPHAPEEDHKSDRHTICSE